MNQLPFKSNLKFSETMSTGKQIGVEAFGSLVLDLCFFSSVHELLVSQA